MDEELRKKRINLQKSIKKREWYPAFAFRKFSLNMAINMIVKHWLLPIITLESLRYRIERWLKRDTRPRGYGQTKYAIDRDGDLYMVECPNCGDQEISWSEEHGIFNCPYCDTWFSVYTEDGVRKLVDYRYGDAVLPIVGALDPYAKITRIGIRVPSWWRRREICRDLHDGKDAHGHKPYTIVPSPIRSNESDGQLEKAKTVV